MPSAQPIRRIAINTGGGDAPGLNAVIRAVVVSALNRGWECYGVREGFNGVLFPERYPDGGMTRLNRDRVQVRTGQRRQSAWVSATNVYLKTALGWRIVAHHASPGTPREAQEILESAAVLH